MLLSMLAKEKLKNWTTMAFSRFTFVKLVKGALVYFIVTIVLSAIQLSDSQFQDAFVDNVTNDSALHSVCMENRSCSDLPAVCVTCDFFQDGLPQCNYNANTTFSCWALDDVECNVSSAVYTVQWVIWDSG